jgi:protein-disulfide isomerase
MTKPAAALPIAILAVTFAACSRLPAGSNRAARKAGPVAATIGKQSIDMSQLDDAIAPELAKIETDRYEARREKLGEMIESMLLAEEAKSEGITDDELLKREVTDKVKTPSDDEIKEAYDRVKGQAGNASLAELTPRIRELLVQKGTNARRADFFGELRKKTKVVVRLEAPRFEIDSSAGHAEGPADAPITLVEFSDYQCPFCARSQPTVAKVLSHYDGKIRHVFMDFPLTQLHPLAMQAAVASRCAEEQGKYSEYHERLFAEQRGLSAENLKKSAVELKLDPAAFEDCLGSGKFDAAIQRSLDAGRKVGVSGTPGFFVNGVPIHGSQPFEVFEQTIDAELARKDTK